MNEAPLHASTYLHTRGEVVSLWDGTFSYLPETSGGLFRICRQKPIWGFGMELFFCWVTDIGNTPGRRSAIIRCEQPASISVLGLAFRLPIR